LPPLFDHLVGAGSVGLGSRMPATKSRPEKRGPVAVEGASPAVSAAKAPERLATPNGPVPHINAHTSRGS